MCTPFALWYLGEHICNINEMNTGAVKRPWQESLVWAAQFMEVHVLTQSLVPTLSPALASTACLVPPPGLPLRRCAGSYTKGYLRQCTQASGMCISVLLLPVAMLRFFWAPGHSEHRGHFDFWGFCREYALPVSFSCPFHATVPQFRLVRTCQCSFKSVSDPSAQRHAGDWGQAAKAILGCSKTANVCLSAQAAMANSDLCYALVLLWITTRTRHSLCCVHAPLCTLWSYFWDFLYLVGSSWSVLSKQSEVQRQFHQKTLILHVFSKMTRSIYK